jgi:hypothetical protein
MLRVALYLVGLNFYVVLKSGYFRFAVLSAHPYLWEMSLL